MRTGLPLIGRLNKEDLSQVVRELSVHTHEWTIQSLADNEAPVNSLYYSTTASKLVYKDSLGTVNALY